MKKILLIVLISFFTKNTFAQNYILPNEKVVFSFSTKTGKKLVLAKDSKNKYLIYRFGTIEKIELEYPKTKNKDSFNQFTFSFYTRGGGVQNAGMELNGLHFEIDNFEYSLYENYYAEGNINEIGVSIKNLKTEKIIDLKGNYKTLKGTLFDFRDNAVIQIDKNRID